MLELIQKLEDSKYFGTVSGHRESVNEGIDDCIALVREAFEGKTLVPDGFLMIADCPSSECSGGVIARQVGDSEWEPEQCQWCHERSTMLAASTGEDRHEAV